MENHCSKWYIRTNCVCVCVCSGAVAAVRVTELETDNTGLLGMTERLKEQVTVFSTRIEELERQLGDTQGELSLVATQLTNADIDREEVEEENRAFQLLLEQKEDMLNNQESKEQELEGRVNELQQHHSVSNCVCVCVWLCAEEHEYLLK